MGVGGPGAADPLRARTVWPSAGGECVGLRPGMVLRVEPGLCFAPDIGMRIEDDVLVTRDGYRVLSGTIPKAPEDLEVIVGTG